MKISEFESAKARGKDLRVLKDEADQSVKALEGREFTKALERSRSQRATSRSIKESIEAIGLPEMSSAREAGRSIEILRYVLNRLMPTFDDLDEQSRSFIKGLIEEEIQLRLKWLARQQQAQTTTNEQS